MADFTGKTARALEMQRPRAGGRFGSLFVRPSGGKRKVSPRFAEHNGSGFLSFPWEKCGYFGKAEPLEWVWIISASGWLNWNKPTRPARYGPPRLPNLEVVAKKGRVALAPLLPVGGSWSPRGGSRGDAHLLVPEGGQRAQRSSRTAHRQGYWGAVFSDTHRVRGIQLRESRADARIDVQIAAAGQTERCLFGSSDFVPRAAALARAALLILLGMDVRP